MVSEFNNLHVHHIHDSCVCQLLSGISGYRRVAFTGILAVQNRRIPHSYGASLAEMTGKPL
jgi:hypothetical protein